MFDPPPVHCFRIEFEIQNQRKRKKNTLNKQNTIYFSVQFMINGTALCLTKRKYKRKEKKRQSSRAHESKHGEKRYECVFFFSLFILFCTFKLQDLWVSFVISSVIRKKCDVQDKAIVTSV